MKAINNSVANAVVVSVVAAVVGEDMATLSTAVWKTRSPARKRKRECAKDNPPASALGRISNRLTGEQDSKCQGKSGLHAAIFKDAQLKPRHFSRGA